MNTFPNLDHDISFIKHFLHFCCYSMFIKVLLKAKKIFDHSFFYSTSVFLKDFIFAINALASGSVSKCFLTGSISSLIALATAGLRSPGCKAPSEKSFARAS